MNLFFLPLIAQLGPGGVGYEDDSEEEQPELVLWLKADQLSLSDGSFVENWEDLSGNNHNAQSGGTQAPVFMKSGINQMPALLFEGNSWFRVPEKTNLDGGPGIAIFVVIQPLAIDQGGGMKMITKRNHWNLWGGGLSKETCKYAFNLDFHGRDDNQYIMAHVNGNYPDNKVETEAIYGDTSLSLLVNYNYNGEYAAVRVNGENTSGNKPNPNFAVEQIGQVEDYDNEITIAAAKYEPQLNDEPPVGDFLKGKIAEVALYRTGLDSTQLMIIENYLAAKYDLDIGQSKLFADTVCKFNLIAIGSLNGIDFHREAGNEIIKIREKRESLNANGEFVFIADDNQDLSSTQEDVPENWDTRLNRTWKIEKHGNIDMELWFNFSEAGIVLSREKEYSLLYKKQLSDDFTVLVEDGDAKFGSLIFNLPDEQYSEGYYTVAERTGNTGIDYYSSHEFQIYPNPVFNELTVLSDANQSSLQFVLLDITAKVVIDFGRIENQGNKFVLDGFDEVKEGCYLLNIRNGRQNWLYPVFKIKN